MKNKRRKFLKTACAPVAFSMFGISLIEACSKEDDTPRANNLNNQNNSSGSSSDNSVAINLENSMFSSLNNVGGWINYSTENMLLLRITSTEIRAFSNVCPHQGSQNSWSYNNSKFRCASHGRSFEDSCSGGLTCYTATLEGSTLTVTR
jgi:Rieske Fe-S protein